MDVNTGPGYRSVILLMLRKEILVLKHHVKKPQFTNSDRLLFVSLLYQYPRDSCGLRHAKSDCDEMFRDHEGLVAASSDCSLGNYPILDILDFTLYWTLRAMK